MSKQNNEVQGEHILKEEGRLKYCKYVFGIPGELTLTTTSLYFTFNKIKRFEIPISDILSVNCRKGFANGSDNMFVIYKDKAGQKRTVRIHHVASLVSLATIGNLSRLGGSFFSSWEQAINDARSGKHISVNNNFDDLKELAKLRDEKIITEEEFTTKKKQVLGI